jgi:hypothetical protein
VVRRVDSVKIQGPVNGQQQSADFLTGTLKNRQF